MRSRPLVSGEDWEPTAMGLLVPPRRRRRYDRPVAVDLFAGCGGFSLGLHQAGYHVAGAVELDFNAAVTYTVNLARPGLKFHFDTPEREAKFHRHLEDHLGLRPKPGRKKDQVFGSGHGLLAGDGWISGDDGPGCEHFWIADARKLTGAEILDALDLDVGELDLVVGGPPCQGFSLAGRRNVVDPRNSLVFEFARLVLEMRPKAMVMENVPGMISMTTPEGIPVVDALCRVLSDGGFGGYEALKKTLVGAPTARAAMNGTKVVKDMRGPDDAVNDDPEEDQGDDDFEQAPRFEQEAMFA